MNTTPEYQDLIASYMSMRSRGIALIKEAEKGLKKWDIKVVPCFSEEFLNRKKGE
jgi:hypothetical protein